MGSWETLQRCVARSSGRGASCLPTTSPPARSPAAEDLEEQRCARTLIAYNLCRTSSQVSTYHSANACSEGAPMDALTEHEIEVIVQRLETLVTDLEHDRSTPRFYAFILLQQELAGKNKAGFTLAHI